jgi:predicted transposase YbfD/YdcC
MIVQEQEVCGVENQSATPTHTCDLLVKLQELKDPRRKCGNLKHHLDEVIIIALIAKLAKCDNFVQMEVWARVNEAWLKTFLKLPNGVPSHDTIRRVLSIISGEALQKVIHDWLLQNNSTPFDFAHLDGKTMRGTRHKSDGIRALHILGVWASEAGLSLGQMAVGEKTNEITAAPKLLALLDLKEKVVTADALLCQTEIVEQIVSQEGDYVIAVKGNQPTLHTGVEQAFATKETEAVVVEHTEEEKHGRIETRTVSVLPAKAMSICFGMWIGLLTIIMVDRIRTCLKTGKTTVERAYYISSLKKDDPRIAKAPRNHWGIESMHWTLDVVFGEDNYKIRNRRAAENVSLLNRIATSLLKQESSTESLPSKRTEAGSSPAFLAELLDLTPI